MDRLHTYDAEIAKGRTVKRHVDQLRLRDSNPETSSVTQEDANVLDNHHYPSPESDLPSQATQNPAVSECRYPQRELDLQIVLYQTLMDSNTPDREENVVS